MSNILNSLVLNIGTAESGWWNPDHAARVAADHSEVSETFAGNGKHLVHGVLNNLAIQDAIDSTGHNSIGGSPATSEVYKRIKRETPLVGDFRVMIVKTTPTRPSDNYDAKTKFNGNDIKAIQNLDIISQKQTEVASLLAEYGSAKGSDDHRPAPLKDLKKMLTKIAPRINALQNVKMGVADSADRITTFQKAANNTQEQLNAYANSLEGIFED